MSQAKPASGADSLPGLTIREMRKAAGLTLAELADRAECDKGYLSKVERGVRRPTRYFRDHLARTLAAAIEAPR